MPLVLFDDDPEFAKGYLFTTEALKGGVFLHPWHNMFLSAAHTEADIDEALVRHRPRTAHRRRSLALRSMLLAAKRCRIGTGIARG